MSEIKQNFLPNSDSSQAELAKFCEEFRAEGKAQDSSLPKATKRKAQSSDELLSTYKNAPIRSFGRVKTRKFSTHKNFLIEEILPNFSFLNPQKNDKKTQIESKEPHEKPKFFEEFLGSQICEKASVVKSTCFDTNLDNDKITEKDGFSEGPKLNCLEIGFGFGDFLYDLASKNPQKKFYGCEPHLNGVVNLLAKLEKNPLTNLKLSTIDSRLLLQSFDNEFFSEIFILFPDPWPKLKHFKRRLITSDFLDNFLAPKLAKNGKLIIATDHDSYKTWILAHALQSKNFIWTAKTADDWQNFPEFWHKTKYQKKADLEGRVSCYFELIKS